MSMKIGGGIVEIGVWHDHFLFVCALQVKSDFLEWYTCPHWLVNTGRKNWYIRGAVTSDSLDFNWPQFAAMQEELGMMQPREHKKKDKGEMLMTQDFGVYRSFERKDQAAINQ